MISFLFFDVHMASHASDYVSLAVTLANFAACAAARPGRELAVHLLPDNVEGDGLWIVGTAWPIAAQSPAEAFQLPAGIHKWQAKSGCVFDDAPEGGPFTLLIDNFGACDESSLYEHLRDKLGQTQAGSQSLSPPVRRGEVRLAPRRWTDGAWSSPVTLATHTRSTSQILRLATYRQTSRAR